MGIEVNERDLPVARLGCAQYRQGHRVVAAQKYAVVACHERCGLRLNLRAHHRQR